MTYLDRSQTTWIPLALTLAVLVMRWPFLGHPMIHVDEQFYLLAGQRMIEGWVPYVDLWDRKPIGLFLLYGAIRLLGGEGIWQYQIVAAIFVIATAYLVFVFCRREEGVPASFAAALIYASLLAPLNGAGGQSPVFYNLLMVASALLVVRAGESIDAATYRQRGALAMVCAGIALQIKYSAVIEGVLFGLWLLYSGHRARIPMAALARSALQFVGIALMPTLMAAGWYASAGELDIFVRANFISIFERGDAPKAFELSNLVFVLRMIGSTLVVGIAAIAWMWYLKARDRHFLTAWAVFAVVGFLAVGNYYDHYALPVLLPLAIILSRLFAVRFAGPLLFALLFAQATAVGLLRYSPKAQSQAATAAMTAEINVGTKRGDCLFVADAPLVLYLTSKACGPWRYSFPFHLTDATEAGAGDGQQSGAMRAILSSRPGAIVTGTPQFTPTVQTANVALLTRTLERNYTEVGRYRDRERHYIVWLRRDLAVQ